MAEDETRNALALDLVLAEVEAGNQVLVLSHRVEHCQRFDAALAARAVPCDLMLGGDEWKGRFDATKRGLADGSLRVAAGTIQAIGTGIDLPAVGRGVLTTPIGSNRQLYGQVRGRLCRPGKADAVLYVLWDRHVHGESTLKFLARWNRTVVVRDTDGAWLDVREYNRRQAT
jgi:superfamily II DNA or RNA helicase